MLLKNKGFKLKRDWEIIRELLAKLEDSETPNTAIDARNFDYPEQNVAYNMRLLHDSGFIKAKILESTEGDNLIHAALATTLTNSGHELLDIIRNDSLWAKIKEKFKSSGIEMTFDLVLSIGKKIMELSLS